jgi:hypothetical protein
MSTILCGFFSPRILDNVACKPIDIIYAPLTICFHHCVNNGNVHMHCIM